MGDRKETIACKRLRLVISSYLSKVERFQEAINPRLDYLLREKDEVKEYYNEKKENGNFKYYTFNKVMGVLLSYKANFEKLSKKEKMLEFDVFFESGNVMSCFDGKFDLSEVAKWIENKNFSADEYFYYIEGCYQELVNRTAKLFGVEPPVVQLWYEDKVFDRTNINYDAENRAIVIVLGNDIKKDNSISMHLYVLNYVLSFVVASRTYSYMRGVYNGSRKNISTFDAYLTSLYATEVAMRGAEEKELDRTVIPTCFDENEKICNIFSQCGLNSPVRAFNVIMGFELLKKAVNDSCVNFNDGKIRLFNLYDETCKEMCEYFEREKKYIDLNFVSGFYSRGLSLLTMMSDFNLSLGFNSSYSDKDGEVVNFVGANSLGYAPIEAEGFSELMKFFGVKTNYEELGELVEKISEFISLGDYNIDNDLIKMSYGKDDIVISSPIENGLVGRVVALLDGYSDGEIIKKPDFISEYDDKEYHEDEELGDIFDGYDLDDFDDDYIDDEDEKE